MHTILRSYNPSVFFSGVRCESKMHVCNCLRTTTTRCCGWLQRVPMRAAAKLKTEKCSATQIVVLSSIRLCVYVFLHSQYYYDYMTTANIRLCWVFFSCVSGASSVVVWLSSHQPLSHIIHTRAHASAHVASARGMEHTHDGRLFIFIFHNTLRTNHHDTTHNTHTHKQPSCKHRRW